MGLFGFLAGNTRSVEKVVDYGAKGIDAVFYTAEEKAEYNKRMSEIYLKFVEAAANESTAQSISRRMICLPVVYLWLLAIIAGVALEIFGVHLTSLDAAIINLTLPASGAIGFYVGRHIVMDWSKGK